jgi:hypothetical protein
MHVLHPGERINQQEEGIMSASQIVTHPSMAAFARALGIPPLRNRIEDAEVEIELEARHTIADQRQAASEEMNRGGK